MCEHSTEIDAYYDGELNAAQRLAFELHLASCDSCRDVLDEMRAVSRIVSTATPASTPSDLTTRILARCTAERILRDAGTRRLAGWMTAAAAIVLLAAIIRAGGFSSPIRDNPTVTEATSVASRDWEFAAVMPPDRQTEDAGSVELVQFAQWMASDLSPDDQR